MKKNLKAALRETGASRVTRDECAGSRSGRMGSVNGDQ